MKRRILSLTLALCILLTLIPSATAYTATPADTKSAPATRYSDTDIAYPVEGGNIYFNAWAGKITDCDESVTSAVIPSKIEGYVVTTIGDSAFEYCTSLMTVTIPDSVTSIDSYAFYKCTSLTSVTIPNSVTTIGDSAFEYCTSLTSVTIPNSVTSIETWTFAVCSSLTNVTIPNSVTSIGFGAFQGCTSLTSVTIPNSVTSIEGQAFYECTNLKSITIPESVTSIGRNAFSSCISLTGIWVDENNENYASDNYGVLFNKDKTTLIKAPGAIAKYTIPDSVTIIGSLAFAGCESLSSVTIPNSVTSIESWTFSGCESLSSVTIPNSVTTIGDRAFQYCTSLTSITIPYSVTSIGDNAFYKCASLTGIWVHENNKYYSSDEYGVLFNKDKTTLIQAPGAIAKYTIPDSVTSIGDSAFEYCTSLTSVTIPYSVTNIGDNAFYKCTNLTGIWIDEKNEYYSSDEYGVLFDKDKSTLLQAPGAISKYTIPDSVTSIGDDAFEYCTSLTSVTIPDSVTSIGDYAFFYCTGLTSAAIGNSVASIGSAAFAYCESLTTVTIPNSVTSIGEYAFFECTSLKSVMIGNSVTSIDWAAFAYCESLSSVYFLGDAPEIGDSVFVFSDVAGEYPGLTLYYIEGKEGWTTPEWNGYPTAKWSGFVDVSLDGWYASAVEYIVENGLMNGMGKNEFRPEEAMTRAMLVTVLWRYAGSPVEGENTFNDLTQDWYVQAVAWASENGIVNGYPDGTFKPDEKVTREQLATIVYRFSNTVGIDTSARADLTAFPDANKVNSYASDAIPWAVSVGLITGITHGGNPTAYLEPQTSATRAQVATILMRFIENVAK